MEYASWPAHTYGPYPNDPRLAKLTFALLAAMAIVSVILIVAAVLEGG